MQIAFYVFTFFLGLGFNWYRYAFAPATEKSNEDTWDACLRPRE